LEYFAARVVARKDSMEFKHTPGPWIGAGPSFGDPLPHYTTEILVEEENEDGDNTPICSLPFESFDTENEANARLIAAAPDLLDALDTLCNRIELEGATPLDWPAYTQARAAIAKAVGA
jgi:hypothetical protein